MSRLALPSATTTLSLNPLEQCNSHSIKEVLGQFARFAQETNDTFRGLYEQVQAPRRIAAPAGSPFGARLTLRAAPQVESTSARTYQLSRRLNNIKRASAAADGTSRPRLHCRRIRLVRNRR
jgi:hypothetical protein